MVKLYKYWCRYLAGTWQSITPVKSIHHLHVRQINNGLKCRDVNINFCSLLEPEEIGHSVQTFGSLSQQTQTSDIKASQARDSYTLISHETWMAICLKHSCFFAWISGVHIHGMDVNCWAATPVYLHSLAGLILRFLFNKIEHPIVVIIHSGYIHIPSTCSWTSWLSNLQFWNIWHTL